jgi:uncharacterized membrane protein YfcA
MDPIVESILFAAASGLSLAGGIATHVIGFKLRRRIPVRVLRALYSSAVICAGVGMLLFGDQLFA